MTCERSTGSITWTGESGTFTFDRVDYDREVERFVTDRDWAPVDRRAEYAVAPMFEGRALDDRLGFDWASARITPNVMVLSFTDRRVHEQRLLEFSWDGESIDSALNGATRLLRERFDDGI